MSAEEGSVPSPSVLEHLLRVPGEDDITSKSDEHGKNAISALSWHEHVYKKLSSRPTPHFIANILGLPPSVTKMNNNSANNCGDLVVPKGPLKVDLGDKDLNEPAEPLNLTIPSKEHTLLYT